MTILGVQAIAADRLICWTDSELYAGGTAVGCGPKLMVNPLAAVTMVATGHSTLLRAADEPMLRGATLDEIAAAIPAALRRRAGQVAHRLTACRQSWLAGQTVVTAGFSREHRRMVLYAFHGSNFFEPVLGTRLYLPALPEEAGPRDMPELVAFARWQIAVVRGSHPGASGGALQVAELRSGSISCTTVPDFDVGARSDVMVQEVKQTA